MARPKSRKTAPRIKKPIIELLPPETEEGQQQPQPKIIEVKHKTEWSEMRPVEEAPPAEDDMIFDDEEIEEGKPRRRTSEREELKKKLAKGNITPGSQLKLTIERYLHSEATDGQGGSYAEREHCTKYICEEEHILSEDYLDTARKYGPGLYRFTVRMKNIVVTAWDKRISAAAIASAQAANGADPNAPIIYTNGDAQTPMPTLKDYMRGQREALKEQLEMAKLLREAYGPIEQQTPAPTDPKIAALQLISENPDVMEKIGSGIAKTVLGAKGGGDSDPWADVAMEAIKSGQAAQIAATIIREIMAPFRNMRGEESAQTFQAPQPAPVQTERNGGPQGRNAPQPTAPVSAERPQERPAAAQPMMTPADALMMALIDAMIRNAPLKEAQGIINVAVYRNPELDESIDELLNLSVDELMALLAVYHPKVAEVPHAKEWLETLVGSLAQQEAAE